MADERSFGERLASGNRGLQISSDTRSRHLDTIRDEIDHGTVGATTAPAPHRRRLPLVAIPALAVLILGLGTAIAVVGAQSGQETVQAELSAAGLERPPSPVSAADAPPADDEDTAPPGDGAAPATSTSAPARTDEATQPEPSAVEADTSSTTSSSPASTTRPTQTTITTSTPVEPTTTTPSTTDTTPAGGPQVVLYLQNGGDGDTSSSATLPLDPAPPTSDALPNFDADRDDAPGLLVQKDGAGLSTSDDTKRQDWTYTFADPTVLQGPAEVTVWLAAKDHKTDEAIGIQVALDLCSTTCLPLATGEWSGEGRSSFQSVTVDLGDLDVQASADSTLRLRIVAPDALGTTDLWIAYDTTTYPTRLVVG